MLNSFLTEIKKLKKNKIYIICLLITLIAAAFLVIKDMFLAEPPGDYMTWAYGAFSINLIFLPVMSSLVLTFLIQREYQEQPVINVLTAPVSRLSFIGSKLMIWFAWYAVAAALNVAINIGGYYLLYRQSFSAEGALWIFSTLLKLDIFGFLVFVPLLWIAVVQKKDLLSCGFSRVGFYGYAAGCDFNIGRNAAVCDIPAMDRSADDQHV